MEKVKIKGISSEEYPGGRIDVFIVPLVDESEQGINHSKIIPLFTELGFSEKDVLDLDMDFENKGAYPSGTYFFVYGNSKIKAFIIIEECTMSLIFDTSLPREEINKKVEKYFKFPE